MNYIDADKLLEQIVETVKREVGDGSRQSH